MRFLRFFIVLCALAGVVCATPANAQDTVSVRTGSHKGYVRLVFEWPAKPEYSVSKEGGRILVRFSKAAKLDLAGVNASESVLKKIETLSGPTEPLQVAVGIPDGSRFRDFVVEGKLIIDVYDAPDAIPEKEAVAKPALKAAAPVEPKPPVKTPEDKPAEKPAEPKPVEKTQEPSGDEPAEKTGGDFTVQPAPSAEVAPVGDVEASVVPPPAFEANILTMTSTTSTGMAVFVRSGVLWMITDSTDVPIAPQIAGPQKDKFPPVEKMDVPGGIAYHMDIPEGLNVYGEGGGLSWRVILTPKAKDVSPVYPLAAMADGGSKLIWPLKEMRKIISFTDPVIGDKITAVTASDAGQFTGPTRNYVNLQTLDSVIGLAFVAKSDDIVAEKTISDVSVGRPGGLSLSETKDVQPGQIRKAMEDKPPETPAAKPDEQPAKEAGAAVPDEESSAEKPAADEPTAEEEQLADLDDKEPSLTMDDLSKAAEEKPTENNIYNFPRWEMGGLSVLENNLHVMMVEVSNKKEEARGEDIIMMAKLNLANDRGPEALGLLRIALQKVPELEDNAEFQALRGAALTLSGKYDEAVIDYSRDALKKYDDVKYWLAYTLAGLEDWKQAITVMPKDFAPIANYPKEIRIPLALTFAEIALRGGDVTLATKILDTLKPELPKLSLPYASSWNYLTGEASRQSGNPKEAVEYWEPLVKNGKDDLFRAKAGLSLTKLQLDQKQIKSAEAIDRLEGLRYAWRGDELETLINYRLGQMYIENKDYLKGLTVLRNAATLAPQSDMGKDVTAYMTKAFRDVFTNDRLKGISPLEAISLHEEFKDLLPPGDEGDGFVEKLAERLVDADLLGRAAALLEYQVNNRLQGDKKAEIAIRLAAIRLLDGNPDGALRSLEIAQDTLDKMNGLKPVTPAAAAEPKPEGVKPQAGEAAPVAAKADEPVKVAPVKADPEKQRQIYLLKARALSMKKKTDEAMAILEGMRLDADVNRLRTDIAWGAARWDDAAMALNDLIVTEDISPSRPLTEYQRDIILNRAIALNLSGNRVALSNLRERYNAQMKETTKGQIFEVVTRPRRPDMIGSREAIESMISEIDLFKGFLEGYVKMEDAGKPKTPEPAAVKDPVPVDGKAADTVVTPEATVTTKTLPEESPAEAKPAQASPVAE